MIPATFDEYRLIRPLGQGAMGQVYLAHDTLLDRLVAIKFVSAASPDAVARERFLIEARAIARLQHPNVVAIHRVSQVSGLPYLVSELVRGQSLEKLPRPIPWERALRIGIGVARGLAAAHESGVLHRDIKPANIMLAEDGGVKLLDFGLAKLVSGLPHAEEGQGAPGAGAGGAPLLAAVALALSSTAPRAGGASSPGPGPRPGPDLQATASFTSEDGTPVPRGTPWPEDNGATPSALTGAGALLGTPRYMAPEAWRGEPATPRTDIYSLGAVLFELCAGHPPHREGTLGELRRAATERDAPPLQTTTPQVDARFAQVIDRCLRRDPLLRFASGAELSLALEELSPEARAVAVPAGNPYRGLQTFEAEHRALFFGRARAVRDLLDLLRHRSLVVAAGDSGVGKSSLCRAGVLPLCEEGALADGRRWRVLRTTPGRRPARALCEALAPVLAAPEETLRRVLCEAPADFGRLLRSYLGDCNGVVIFLDQAEELVTQGDPAEAVPLCEALGHLGEGLPGVAALLTVRSDFLTRLSATPVLGEALGRALYLVRPLQSAELIEAITGPARQKGVRFESEEMVRELAQATAQAQGGLPLLQFALAELWDARDEARGLIPASALSAIGGVGGALARHGDAVLGGMPPPARAAARRILCRLVTPQGTRICRGEAELIGEGDAAAAARQALEALVRGRLVFAHGARPVPVPVPGSDDALPGAAAAGVDGPSYELSHEALLQGWGTLRRLLDTGAERRALLARVEAAAAEWERLQRSREALWGERQLGEVESLLGARERDEAEDLAPREAAFLRTSREAAVARRRTRRLIYAGVPLSVLLFYGGFSLKASYQLGLRVQARLAEAAAPLKQARAEAEAAARLRAQAFSLFDAPAGRSWEEGEAAYAQARKAEARARAAYAQAGRALEAAAVLDRGRARRPFAEVLFEQALLLSAGRRQDEAEDLIGRLAAYDDEGALRRQIAAPASLSVETTPPGAAVSLSPVVDDGGRRREGAAMALGRAPLSGVSLAPGSYVVVLSVPGRPIVRAPILLLRGEHLALQVPVPARVPAGMVYVPPGRFLFGSGDDEAVRRSMLTAQPLHQVHTAGYLIGRHEVTFGAWIEYLRALAPEERGRRLPRATGTTGALALRERAEGGFQLTMQPTTRVYTAGPGERVVYPGRRRQAAQDWLRMPVAGISWEDGEAYAAWLDRTGRLPGARVCDEHQWERAARGADGRAYPHGDRLAPEDANFDETYGRQPLGFGLDEVGSHGLSDSPFGVADMAGNVWEWVRSLRQGEILIRGGSFYQDQISSRSANRQPGEHTWRSIMVGLRLCASPVTG